MKCCICGKEIKGYGNNPAPFNVEKEARCCDECNLLFVIPSRLNFLGFNKKEKKEIKEKLSLI